MVQVLVPSYAQGPNGLVAGYTAVTVPDRGFAPVATMTPSTQGFNFTGQQGFQFGGDPASQQVAALYQQYGPSSAGSLYQDVMALLGNQNGAPAAQGMGQPMMQSPGGMQPQAQMFNNFANQFAQYFQQYFQRMDARLSRLEEADGGKSSSVEGDNNSPGEAIENKREKAHLEVESLSSFIEKIKEGHTAFKLSDDAKVKERQIKYLDNLLERCSDTDEKIDSAPDFAYQKGDIFNRSVLKDIGLALLMKDPQWRKENRGDLDLSGVKYDFIKTTNKDHQAKMTELETEQKT